ncbi:hypothetical protein D3C81_2016660 [compost metagenome]
MARSARPYSVLPKNSHKARISSAQVATTNRLCADQVMRPRSIWPLTNAGVRQPSAPKNTSARPISAKWTATETISSTSTVASARGW